jgi:hypothetical protein
MNYYIFVRFFCVVMGKELNSSGLKYVPMTTYCEHINKLTGSIKGSDFLNRLSFCNLMILLRGVTFVGGCAGGSWYGCNNFFPFLRWDFGYCGHYWPIVPAPDDGDCGEIGGMKIGRENRSTRRKPAPAPLWATAAP